MLDAADTRRTEDKVLLPFLMCMCCVAREVLVLICPWFEAAEGFLSFTFPPK